MTDEEVQIIYDYLHENYIYKNGDLVRKISRNGHAVGSKLGTFSYNDKWNSAHIKSVIVINKKRFASTLAHFMWIFHYNKKPRYIEFIDGNVTNVSIENLREISVAKRYLENTKNSKGIFKIINGKGVSWRASIHKNKKSIFLGYHANKKDAENAYNLAREAIFNDVSCPLEIKKYVNEKLGTNKIPINKNKNGFKGIKKTKAGTYYGRSEKKGHRIQTACYKTPEEAYAAYLEAKKDYENS